MEPIINETKVELSHPMMSALKVNMDKFMWTRDEAVDLIKECWNGCAVYGYHIALTGSVLYHGVSDNDLDLVLYPRISPHDDYREALEHLCSKVGVSKMHVIKWDNVEHKLVFEITTLDQKKINIFVPGFTLKGLLNTNIQIISNKGTKSST